jgi:hypothetical protein
MAGEIHHMASLICKSIMHEYARPTGGFADAVRGDEKDG